MKVDHYTLMLDAIEVGNNSKSEAVAQTKFALAQVHATAYAGQQQETANLIMVLSEDGPDALPRVTANYENDPMLYREQQVEAAAHLLALQKRLREVYA